MHIHIPSIFILIFTFVFVFGFVFLFVVSCITLYRMSVHAHTIIYVYIYCHVHIEIDIWDIFFAQAKKKVQAKKGRIYTRPGTQISWISGGRDPEKSRGAFGAAFSPIFGYFLQEFLKIRGACPGFPGISASDLVLVPDFPGFSPQTQCLSRISAGADLRK